jgi:hypothetical protein
VHAELPCHATDDEGLVGHLSNRIRGRCRERLSWHRGRGAAGAGGREEHQQEDGAWISHADGTQEGGSAERSPLYGCWATSSLDVQTIEALTAALMAACFAA